MWEQQRSGGKLTLAVSTSAQKTTVNSLTFHVTTVLSGCLQHYSTKKMFSCRFSIKLDLYSHFGFPQPCLVIVDLFLYNYYILLIRSMLSDVNIAWFYTCVIEKVSKHRITWSALVEQLCLERKKNPAHSWFSPFALLACCCCLPSTISSYPLFPFSWYFSVE